MSSLSEVMYRTRAFVKLSLISIFSLIIIWNIYKYLYAQYQKAYPPPPPPPTVYYGVLPAFSWPKSLSSLPEAVEVVYKIPKVRERRLKNQVGYVLVYLKNRANIWGPAELAQTASVMGFGVKEGRLKDRPTWVRFYNTNKTSYLDIDEATGYFEITTPDINQLGIQAGGFLQDEEITNFLYYWLDKASYWSDELEVAQLEYFRLLGNQKIRVDTITDAQIVKVDYRRRLVFGRSSFFNTGQALVSFEVARLPQAGLRVLQARFHYRPVFLRKPATYPLIFPAKSWEYVKQGKALILKAPQTPVTVDKVDLIFYDSLYPYRYMIPAYLFSSSNGTFQAISSALPEKWLPLKAAQTAAK